jgi:prepilin-type N-terminal cleavage/methylation domain-containing protein
MKKLMPKPKGFTIIEVIIVLVIGAVIMLAVFLVVPQLQRTQRNSRRQNDARRLLTAAINYTTANPGSALAASTIITASIADLSTSPNLFIDPDGVPYSVDKDPNTPSGIKTNATATLLNNASETMRMVLNYKAKCDGISVLFIGGTAEEKNKIAVSVYQEPATYACFSNN